jgi:hypothetical protein
MDFVAPKPDEEPRQDEMRLSYVTMTRGKLIVARGSLAWPRDRGESGRAVARLNIGLDADDEAGYRYDAHEIVAALPGGTMRMPEALADAIRGADWTELDSRLPHDDLEQ